MKTDTITYAKFNKAALENTEHILREKLQTLISEEENYENKLGLSCAKLSSSWLKAYSASD